MGRFISLLSIFVICGSAYAIPNGRSIPLNGDPGSVVTGDFDQDGNQDLALILAKTDESRVITVLWGDSQNKFGVSSEISMEMKINEAGLRPTMRDTTSRSIVVADFNDDGKVDIGTSAGIALNQGDRKFSWKNLKNKTTRSIQPVGLLSVSGKIKLVVRVNGGVDLCTPNTCSALIRSDFLKDDLHLSSEMLVFDFDGDKKLDILAGSEFLDSENSYIWFGRDDFSETFLLEGVPPIDIQLYDVNGDGRIDLLAQVKEFISDFPSETKIFLNQPGGLELAQKFTNFDNHNDNATVIRRKDGCFDYYQVGVDRGVGVLSSTKDKSGKCTFGSAGLTFKPVTDVGGTGVQCLSLAKDKCSLAVRKPMTSVDQGSLWIETP